MKVRLKLSGSEYRTFGIFAKTMLDVSCQEVVDPLERINMIEGCEHLLQKVGKDLITSYKKRYTIVLNGNDCHIIMMGFDIITDFGQKEMPIYENICWHKIATAIYDEANALLRHRENLKGNMEMAQLN